ncbi:hypothetical protein [Paratractidigestivibacter sp.]|uniref:hypothetical protein n=1 Tax=Paratractidigestivibacter sp. TaxID=2847316 RepID=UPI002ABDFB9F|nr:hypothetical protein [Paratractidigestivibacter sp.]
MAWDYAELTHLAKISGGPEALVQKIEMGGVLTGRKQMLPVVGAALLLGAAIPTAVKKIKGVFVPQPNVSPAEVTAAKEELIAGIKAYDCEHPDGPVVEKQASSEGDGLDEQ